MSGVCFECLLEIDGVPSQQACQVQAREGMKVRVMNGVPGVCACGGNQHD
jgi:predicted molibdopterin-dependent oxidoreductase YjgC